MRHRVHTLRPVEEIERSLRGVIEFMQTVVARAKRIAQIRAALATLTEDERFGLACELLGVEESDLTAVFAASSASTASATLPTGEG